MAAKDSQAAKDELKGSQEELKEANQMVVAEKAKVEEMVGKQQELEAKVLCELACHI